MSKCRLESCDREAVSQGYCRKCYKREKRKGTIVNVEVENTGSCIKEGCNRPQYSKGLCEPHYRQIQRANNPTKCSVDGCDKPNVAKGFCKKHYGRAYHGREIQDKIKEQRLCSVDGCGGKYHAKGLCRKHYFRVMRTGSVESAQVVNTGLCIVCNERLQSTLNMCERCYQYHKNHTDAEYRKRNTIKSAHYRARKFGVSSEPYTVDDIMKKTGGLCGICGKQIDLSISLPRAEIFSFDHIIPLSKGGSDLIENIQPAHFSCNCSKSNRMG